MNALARLHELNAELEAIMLETSIGTGWKSEKMKYNPAIPKEERSVSFYKPGAEGKREITINVTRTGPKERHVSLLLNDDKLPVMRRVIGLRQAAQGLKHADKRKLAVTQTAKGATERADTQRLVRYQKKNNFNITGVDPKTGATHMKRLPQPWP